MNRRRMIVTGRQGQVAASLVERSAFSESFEIVTLGRPTLDLSAAGTIAPAIKAASPDIIVSAAAYTAVDRAEDEEELAMLVNGAAPVEIARVAAELSIPVIHISTDYVFDGTKSTPYVEDDQTAPLSSYGRSKLAGERAVAAETENHLILRTAWLYGPHGGNFLKTMLRLSEQEDPVSVVDDQIGNPTSSLDLADAILTLAEKVVDDPSSRLRGVFHLTAAGEASWADFASEIFAIRSADGRSCPPVKRISSRQYPARAVRPANSRLDCSLIKRELGVAIPDWKSSLAKVVNLIAFQDQADRRINRT